MPFDHDPMDQHPRLQIPIHKAQHAAIRNTLRQAAHQYVMVDAVKEFL